MPVLVCLLSHAGLEIYFEKSIYKIEEGARRTLGSCTNISFQFRNNQSPFTLTLSSVSIDTAEKMGLGVFKPLLLSPELHQVISIPLMHA